ncbi:MAG: ABC transporter substrate-binding protein [Eubacteriales bacterium]
MKKAMALILAIVILSLPLLSCGESGEKPALADSTTQASETPTGSTDPRDLYPSPEVKDFEGYEFRMLTNENLTFQQVEYFADEQTGDLMNDTIYTRNRKVEDQYNIKISYIEQSDVVGTIRKSVQAGDDICDIFMPTNVNDVYTLAQQNMVLDLNELSSLQLDQPWFDPRSIEGLTVNGKLFCVAGDFNMRDELRQMSITYNKKIYADFGFENPYELVNSGKWTFDRMGEMSKAVTKDLDGDGKLGILDQWGLMTETAAGWYLYLGSGRKSILNEGGKYVVDIGDAAMHEMLDKIITLLSDKSVAICMDDGKVKTDLENIWKEATRMYINNQVLFRTGTFGDTVDLRNMETDFGVLPIPKMSETQDGYYCMVTTDFHPITIPTTVPDAERTALIVDALSYESMFILRPAFYSTFLSQKILRDEESVKMVDILFKSKIYDFDFITKVTGLSDALGSMVASGNNTLASKVEAIQDSAQTKLDKLIEKLPQ